MAQAPLLLQAVHRSYWSGPLWRRQRRAVLRGIDLQLFPGQALALRGDNGAGKSTLLRLIAGILSPDEGVVSVLGDAPERSPAARARIGFASGDERSLFQRLTGRHNLEFFGALHGLAPVQWQPRIERLSDELDLHDVLDRRVDQCSAGMKARLGLARALLHDPAILLLDEPTKSLDAQHAAQVRAALRQRVAEGLIVIAATHAEDESADLEARVSVLRDGILVDEPSGERQWQGGRQNERRDSTPGVVS